jgi:hypothetical protein
VVTSTREHEGGQGVSGENTFFDHPILTIPK